MGKFWTGKHCVTHEIDVAMREDIAFFKEIREALGRYCRCDWGDTASRDCKENDRCVAKNEAGILAAYETKQGRIFISTTQEENMRYTLVMFASEY